MASSFRRSMLAASMLPLLVLATSRLASATTLTVTNLSDTGVSGDGSLRGEILAAASGDTIEFASGLTGTIGLLAANGTLGISKSVTINGPTTSPGIAIDGQGAVRVMFVNPLVTLNIANLTIENGSATAAGFTTGGGISSVGTLNVTNCTFSGNSAGTSGGAISTGIFPTMITNSTFSNNSAGAFGGGIFNNGPIVVTNSTFSKNSASSAGGGIFNNVDLLTVTNSTFSGNSANVSGGGGIYNNSGTLMVTNCTFSGNSAPAGKGGGISNQATASLKGTILAGESSGGNCGGFNAVGDAGYNISDDGSCAFSGTSVNNSTTLNLDPAGLQNNGGPTETIALDANSQAVDFIPVGQCTDQSSMPVRLETDQRGEPRPDSGNTSFCDAGAFELETRRITVVPGSEKTQIARPTTSMNSDQVNMAFTFFDIGSPIAVDGAPNVPRCDPGNDALNGINVDLFEGTCASPMSGGLILELTPFVVHSIGGHSYGTIFQSDPPDMLQQTGESVSARIVTLSEMTGAPDGISCGEWTINIEVAGLDTSTLGLGGGNPFALVVEDGDKNEGCFDIDNAVVGSQIPPPTHGVRRGSRRGRR